MIYVGVGQEDVDMYRGNFKITDYVTERFPLKLTDVIHPITKIMVLFHINFNISYWKIVVFQTDVYKRQLK